ncbi:MAG TPA: ribosome biogenesis GTPase YqeH [Firmicutes bacterium]|nr:ribosome biogenesis GTPase YqeH [Bacillota bacterium]
MSEFNVVRRCYGCGVILQSEDPAKPGYIDPEIVGKAEVNAPLFCQACWKQTKYNSAPLEPSASQDFLSMLRDAKASDALIVFVVNLFSFECSLVPEVCRILEGLKLLVLANKRDLLPKKADDSSLRKYVSQRFRKARLSVSENDVCLISLRSDLNVDRVVSRMQKERQGHDVYVIGAAGAGKTIFVNAFLRSYANPSSRAIGISKYPRTELSVMTIPLDSSSSLFDTPGTSLENSMITHVDASDMKRILPQSEIKARSYSLSKGEKLILGDDLASIELLNGARTPVKLYCSNEVSVSKRLGTKIEDAFYRFADQIRAKREKNPSADFDAFETKIEEKGERDIGIEGLGWICFRSAGQTFRIYVRKGVSLYSGNAKIKIK